MLFGYYKGKFPFLVSDITNNATILQIIFNNTRIFFKKTLIFAFLKAIIVMIQRIQSVYMLIVALLGALLPLWLDLWTNTDGGQVFAKSEPVAQITFYASSALAFIAIVLFKNRQNQFVANRLNMIFNLFLLGFFVYRSLNLSGETLVSEKGIGMLIPVFSIVFLVLANRAIKKDEDLVKSVDRLR